MQLEKRVYAEIKAKEVSVDQTFAFRPKTPLNSGDNHRPGCWLRPNQKAMIQPVTDPPERRN
jgi:hypothetical protein